MNVIGFLNLIKPTCSICSKEVDEILLNHNFARDSIVISVFCHNAIDNMEILNVEVPYIDFSSFGKGYAFNKKCLTKDKLLENF